MTSHEAFVKAMRRVDNAIDSSRVRAFSVAEIDADLRAMAVAFFNADRPNSVWCGRCVNEFLRDCGLEEGTP